MKPTKDGFWWASVDGDEPVVLPVYRWATPPFWLVAAIYYADDEISVDSPRIRWIEEVAPPSKDATA